MHLIGVYLTGVRLRRAPHWHASHRRVHHGRASYGAYFIGVRLAGVYLNAAFGGHRCCISHFGAKWQLGTLCPYCPPVGAPILTTMRLSWRTVELG
jgi:hypothetical protein